MRNILLSAFFASFIIYLPASLAEASVSCSHPELCRLAKIIFQENHMQNYQFEALVKIVGDPHEYEPTSTEIKNLIKAEILIAGPSELNPWIKKVNYQRSKRPNLKTMTVPMEKTDHDLYPKATAEALSHFWLYPKIFCNMKARLEEQLISSGMLLVLPTRKTCTQAQQKIETELSATLEKVNLPVVLTHDALQAILESVSTPRTKIVAIKGSGHHQETSTASVKKLYDALKAPRAIWVEEKGIHVPANILAKKRKDDLTVTIDTANSTSERYFQVLEDFNEKLKALKP